LFEANSEDLALRSVSSEATPVHLKMDTIVGRNPMDFVLSWERFLVRTGGKCMVGCPQCGNIIFYNPTGAEVPNNRSIESIANHHFYKHHPDDDLNPHLLVPRSDKRSFPFAAPTAVNISDTEMAQGPKKC
jgi:hypothetical protein